MKLVNRLAGIDLYKNCWLYCENTIKLVEAVAEDVDRELVNYVKPDKSFWHINLTSTIVDLKSPNPIIHKIVEDYQQVLKEVTKDYYQHYGIVENAYELSGYHWIKHLEGGHYPDHYDGPTDSGRHINVILFLNAIEGGTIRFKHHNVTVTPKPGMMLLFPSNFAYKFSIDPITKGNLYMIQTWLHDRHHDS